MSCALLRHGSSHPQPVQVEHRVTGTASGDADLSAPIKVRHWDKQSGAVCLGRAANPLEHDRMAAARGGRPCCFFQTRDFFFLCGKLSLKAH